MAREADQDRLLESWVPPQDAGEPVGFLATTFTFGAQFFEEDCLSAFLQMESDPDSEGLSYVIEREEKLSKVECAMVIADQHHCTSRHRNIRWDLLPFRMRNGIQHAKISLLVWGKTVRLVIASANLTEEAYRRNQEIFSVFDASENASVPVAVFVESLNFLENILRSGVTADAEIRKRGDLLLNRVRQTLSIWNLQDSNNDQNACQVWPVFAGPGRPSVFQQIKERWQSRYSFLPDRLEVVSPFFDTGFSPVHPLTSLDEFLTARADIEISTTGEKDLEPDGLRRMHLPAYYAEQLKERLAVKWFPEMTGDGKDWRPLHMKSLRAFRANWCMVMSGSSNFTAAGLGTAPGFVNYEANVLFLASSSRDPDSYQALTRCLPAAVALKNGEYRLDETGREDEGEDTEIQTLPECLLSAEADLAKGRTIVRLTMKADKMLEGLTVRHEGGAVIYNARKDGAVDRFDYVWADASDGASAIKSLPAGFEVTWSGTEKRAWLPLNVINYEVLPTPAELKDLPFHILLQVITSAKPLQVILRRYSRQLKQEALDETPADPMTDPHKRVDTSGFLLQRTRRISYAFNSIREKLSLPVSNLRALHWRLYGPVGLKALVEAILSDRTDADLKLPEERLFFLAELMMELAAVKTNTATNHLPAEAVRSELDKFIAGLKPRLTEDPALEKSWIGPYVVKIMQKTTESV